MANVQIDDGDFTRIANEILEQLVKAKLNGTQYAIIFILWLYTYGHNKPDIPCSHGFLQEKTGIHRKQVARELAELIGRNIVVVKKPSTFTTPQILCFNENHHTWHFMRNSRLKWRKEVLQKDNFTCQECGSSVGLDAHHIKLFSTHKESRYEINNGVTLCKDCHRQVHSKCGE